MTNAYYTPPSPISAVTKALSSDVNTRTDSIEAAFDKLPTEDNLKRGTVNYAVDTGVVNAYVISLPHAPSGYVDGLLIAFRPLNTNTSSSTVNVNSLGVKSIRRDDGTAISAGDITAGSPISARYSTATGYFHISGNSMVNAAAAAASQAAAAISESNAANSASSASASASAASGSASTASTQASNASSSASTASTQASNASSSASTATTQAGIATTKAGLTALDAIATAADRVQTGLDRTAASNSASAASGSASTATTQAGNASSSASSASSSASTATIQAGIATTKAGEAAASAASIAGGPVTSVNGMTGVVVGLVQQGLQTCWIPSGAMVSRTTNGPSVGSIEMATNKNMFKTLDFDTATSEYAQFAIQMPKSWNEGTVTATFIWSHASTTTNFSVTFGLQAVAISNDDAGDVAFGTAQTATDTGGTTNDIYVSPTTAAITIAGTPVANDYVMFQVYRAVSDGGDTMAIDARLHGIQLFYTTDQATDA